MAQTDRTPPLPEKICPACGRRFEWRARWKRNWDSVVYCGEQCRQRKVTKQDLALEQAILDLLDARAATATICPSEAARRVSPDGWRELMEPTRRAARRLAARSLLEIRQKGKRVDPSSFRGPIRLARRR